MFLLPDEHVILYENVATSYTLDELKRLAECGLRTMWVWHYWQHMEPKKMGEYDWSKVEDTIERSSKAGLKLIMCVPASVPSCCPESWYLKCPSGRILNDGLLVAGFSYWNREAMDYRDRFIEMVCKTYASKTVLCASSFYAEGEYFHPGPDTCKLAICDDAAVASLKAKPEDEDVLLWLHDTFRNFAIHNQKIYAQFNPGRELWQQLHWMFMVPQCGAEILLPLYLETQAVTGCDVHQLFCSAYGDNDRLDIPLKFMGGGMGNIWLGAGWAKGLRANTPSAIKNGFRGLFCAALHPFLPYKRMEEWQFENFKWAIQQWKEAGK